MDVAVASHSIVVTNADHFEFLILALFYPYRFARSTP